MVDSDISQLNSALRCQTQQLLSVLSSASYIVANSMDPDQTRNSLIWVHTVCLYAKSIFGKSARRCSRQHKQMTFSDVVFLVILRVKYPQLVVIKK